MTIQILLEDFHRTGFISEEAVTVIQKDDAFKIELVHHFRQHQDRAFALFLLNIFIAIRQDPEGIMPFEDLMLACYLVGLHQQLEDCLKVWEAKCIDFDTYCGLDIQLVPFAGVSETLAFLESRNTDAYEYVQACSTAGDFNSLEEYYSKEKLPWFLYAE